MSDGKKETTARIVQQPITTGCRCEFEAEVALIHSAARGWRKYNALEDLARNIENMVRYVNDLEELRARAMFKAG